MTDILDGYPSYEGADPQVDQKDSKIEKSEDLRWKIDQSFPSVRKGHEVTL